METKLCAAGRMRCLAALARWEELSILCRESWAPAEVSYCLEMAPMVYSLTLNNVYSPLFDTVTILLARLDIYV